VTHSEKKNGVVGIIENGPGSMNIESITFGLGNGVAGFSSAPDASGVWGFGRAAGVSGTSNEGHGVHGLSNTVRGSGVFGENKAPLAFAADLSHVAPVGVTGLSEHGIGVRGESFYQDYLDRPAPAHSDNISGVWDGGFGVGVDGKGSLGIRGTGYIGIKGTGKIGVVGVGDANEDVGVHAEGNPAVYMWTKGEELIVGWAIPHGAEEKVFFVDKYGVGHFKNGYVTSGFDIAETFSSARAIGPGNVVEIDPHNKGQFRLCATSSSGAVAGVVSTAPGVSLGAWGENGSLPKLALAGRVPVKVSGENGPILPGDLLVSSSIPGHAMRAPDMPKVGTVIGKSLGQLESGTGEIELLVMLS
jgi:hypothetical protein